MLIRILKCSDKLLWYSAKVNKEFVVIRKEPSAAIYWVRTGDEFDTLNFIHVNDVEIVKE